MPLLSRPSLAWKNATFTEYPRCCGPHGTHLPCSEANPFDDSNQCTQTNSSMFFAMGRSIRSRDWRYTRWMRWDGSLLEPVWESVVAEELYDHRGDTEPYDVDGWENANLAAEPSLAAVKVGLAALPSGVTWRHVFGVSLLTGIGFTMSIFIANLAFGAGPLLDSAKVGILAASVVSGVLGAVVLIGVAKSANVNAEGVPAA